MSKKLILMAAAAATKEKEEDIPLRNWINKNEEEFRRGVISRGELSSSLLQGKSQHHCETKSRQLLRQWKEAMIQKATVAYGIVELLNRCPENNVMLLEREGDDDDDSMSVVSIDNFQVCICKKEKASSSSSSDVKGVSMISSGLSLLIEEPSYLNFLMEQEEEEEEEEEGGGGGGGVLGRYLEVELDTTKAKATKKKISSTTTTAAGDQERMMMSKDRCHYLVAKILYELFTSEVFPDDVLLPPASKKVKTSQSSEQRGVGGSSSSSSSTVHNTPVIIERMQQLDLPASICRMMQNLLDSVISGRGGRSFGGGDAYNTLGEICQDLHLLLFDPDRFMFDHHETRNTGGMKLLYRKDKLYGRDKEEKLITDAFCRVTNGKSEAFFIGGFSGSGKSMLVDSLRVNVKNVGGYVIKHKFDAISRDRPLSGVISAVNQLCLKIKSTLKPQRLVALSKKIKDEFGADIGLLARMLPNICVLSPEFNSSADKVADGGGSSPQSVSFTLLRFIRLVSSPSRPIMLFLDDLQWADDNAFDTIHTFLSDTMGCCMLFVGTYRDNEVQIGHAVFDLMENLEISNVPTNRVTLTGLDQENLNEMISDALCLYPRICKSLSDIVFQKTKGNPFFVLKFMESLLSRGLLQYDSGQKRWFWSEYKILAEEITDNVLHLLSSRMNGLSEDMQLLLKVMACFGTSTNELVISCLSESPEYLGVRKGLEGAVGDGYVKEDTEGKFIFVHDKVREAAYNLIPDSEKKQFHVNLGKTLYSICEGKEDVGDTIMLIASQINHGKELIEKDDPLRIPVTKLNMKAGQMALDGCDHKTSYFYFVAGVSLLPDDSWRSDYDLSLRLNFCLAAAANTLCKYEEAEGTLNIIYEKARCLEDKLPAYALTVEMMLAQAHWGEAYTKCSSILTQLGVTVPEPESVSLETAESLVQNTLKRYTEVYGDDWLGKEMSDTTLCYTMKFYTLIANSIYFSQHKLVVAYYLCKAVQLSFNHGVCKYTPRALVILSSFVVQFDNSALVRRIAENGLILSEKLDSSEDIAEVRLFFWRGVGQFHSYQSGAAQLRKSFVTSMSFGNAKLAFYCAGQGTQFSTISAEKDLGSLLKEIDYYLHLLETYKNQMAQMCLLCYRETVSALIDKGETTSIQARLSYADVCGPGPGNALQEVFYFHQAYRCYWLGYSERCQHYVQKYGELVQPALLEPSIIKFYEGLHILDVIRKTKRYSRMAEVDNVISAMRVAAFYADSNFTNKLELLLAEKYGILHKAEALTSYNAAIESARKNKFIHEQGLACEKAGFYCKSMKDDEKASLYFNQARECYEKWGSSMKVEFVQAELHKLRSN